MLFTAYCMYLAVLVLSCRTWNLSIVLCGIQFPDQDGTQAPALEAQSLRPLDHQGSPAPFKGSPSPVMSTVNQLLTDSCVSGSDFLVEMESKTWVLRPRCERPPTSSVRRIGCLVGVSWRSPLLGWVVQAILAGHAPNSSLWNCNNQTL